MLWVYFAILKLQFIQCEDRLFRSETDIYKRQILTSKVGPDTERVSPNHVNNHFYPFDLSFQTNKFADEISVKCAGLTYHANRKQQLPPTETDS